MAEMAEFRGSADQFASRPLRPDAVRRLQRALYNIKVCLRVRLHGLCAGRRKLLGHLLMAA